MPTVLITGASSGLGLAFLEHYASQPHSCIIALDIVPLRPDIHAASLDNVKFFKVDITSTSSLSDVSQRLEKSGVGIDIVIHSAGIRGLVPQVLQEKRDVAAAETWEVMDHGTMMKTMEVNTWGTFNIIKSVLPLLRLTAKKKDDTTTMPKVVVMSSRMGSLSSNSGGGGYAYRASKAALNAMVKSFSIDVPEVMFLMMHPGRVETGLVEWKEEGAFTVDEVLGDCLKVLEKADKEWSGRFVDRWGQTIGW